MDKVCSPNVHICPTIVHLIRFSLIFLVLQLVSKLLYSVKYLKFLTKLKQERMGVSFSLLSQPGCLVGGFGYYTNKTI